MFHEGLVLRKTQWMGIAALIMALIMVLNPVLAFAEEGDSDGEIVIFSSDGNQSVTGGSSSGSGSGSSRTASGVDGGTAEGRAAEIISADELWALVDFEELRAQIDEDEIRSRIDVVALLDNIDRDSLREEIDGEALMAEISEDDLRDEYVQRKFEGENFVVNSETTKGNRSTLHYYEKMTEKEKTDDSLAEIVDQETVVLEDGREVTKFKVKIQTEDEQAVEEHPIDVINVQLPVLGEESPFVFAIDPMHLIYLTNAARYGGGVVEEDASVLFRNFSGEYKFSHKSDMLKVVNKSNVPIKLVVTANIKDSEKITMVDSETELTGTDPKLFMGLTDGEKVTPVVSGSDGAVIEKILKPVADGTYRFTWNEETQKYDYAITDAPSADESADSRDDADTRFDTFSFGMVAACNTEGDWIHVDSRPVISVNWRIEPILSDDDSLKAELDEAEREKFLADTQQYEAFKQVKMGELIEDKLIDLLQVELDEAKEAAFEALFEDELARLANERLDEIIQENGLEDRFVVDDPDLNKKKSESEEDSSNDQARSKVTEPKNQAVLGAVRDEYSEDGMADPDVESSDDEEDAPEEQVVFIEETVQDSEPVIFFD